MAGWGGQRVPGNPAVVSGPGAGSARTDGSVLSPSSPAYGDGVDLQNIKAGAPQGGGGNGPAAPGGAPRPAPTGFGVPSEQPNVPVTAGASAGAGPGLDALGLPQDPVAKDRADVAALGPSLQAMIYAASQPNASPSFRALVRKAISNLQ